MAKIRKVITRDNRYLLEEEVYIIVDNLNNHNYNNKLHKIGKYAYMVELLDIDNDKRKPLLKEELIKLQYNIYKTDKTLKELKEIYSNKFETCNI